MTTSQFFRYLFYYLSPFSIVVVFTLIGGVFRGDPYETGRWTNQAASLFVPAFFVLGPLYALIRVIWKEQILWIWILEILILSLVIFFFYIRPDLFLHGFIMQL